MRLRWNRASFRMNSTSLFTLLLFLLLPRPSRLYSFTNCTSDFYDRNKIVCDFRKLTTIPSDIPKSATYLSLFVNDIKIIRQTEFASFTKLESLHLGNNVISHIEDGAFSHLSALTSLILVSNKLTNLTDNMFKGLSSLISLSLGSNQIETVSKSAFKPLKNLQEMDLALNKLIQISDIVPVFQLPSLEVLYLTENQLTLFENMDFPLNIKDLYINKNPLRRFSIHSDVFPHLQFLHLCSVGPEFEWDIGDKAFLRSLKSLDLTDTKLTVETYRYIFQSVDSLEELYLRNIEKQSIDKGLLDLACGIQSLQKLDLSNNDISILNDTLLQSCSHLTELNLYSNSMTNLSESSFRVLTQLTWLSLESNKVPRVPLATRNISTLKYLSFKSNHIRELQCSDFLNLTSLTELNLNSNQISKFSNCIFKDLHNLEVLHVEKNYLVQLEDSFGVCLPKLVSLNMDGNNIRWLQREVFQGMLALTYMNLNSATVTIVEKGAFEGIQNLKSLTYSPHEQNIGTFRGLPRLEKVVMFLSYQTSELTISNLLGNLPSLQELTMIVNNDICFFWTPDFFKILINLQVLSFDKYCCNTPDPNMFLPIPHVKNLQFTNCKAFSPEPELFQPLPDLQVLNLTNSNVKTLDFFNANFTKLKRLHLMNNKLTVINETILEALPSLKYLDLSGNPFVCNCSNAGFIQWAIQNKHVYVVNAFQYRCSSPLSHDGHFLLNFNVQSCGESTAFVCFISSSALVLVTLLSSFIYHFLRWQLVYGFYLFLAFLYDSKKRRQGCPHIYDAFVSYNVHDEDWVYEELLPELEGRRGWRLCLHHRDFLPGRPIIENITDAIYSSRKTLCVISPHYLQSEWCSREIQMASFRLFDEQKDVLILLFLEEISANQLSPFYRMKKLMKSHTYLSWTQARSHKGLFWEKVQRALETGHQPADDNKIK